MPRSCLGVPADPRDVTFGGRIPVAPRLSPPTLFAEEGGGSAEHDPGRETTLSSERDYFLGTHDAELARLGLQHAVWRPWTLDAWRRAGFTVGQRILDVGCGPGYASLDLADLVGPSGEVIAIDRSRRFLDFGERRAEARGVGWISFREHDLEEAPLPAEGAQAAWCRWVFAFVRRPRELLAAVGDALGPGGRFVALEYFDYGTWRLAPRSQTFEAFVRAVMEGWRASGGEPDVGLSLPAWLAELGFERITVRPIVQAIGPADFVWEWPRSFVRDTLPRMTADGRLPPGVAEEIERALDARPAPLMITPAVLEIAAVKRGGPAE